MTDLANSEFDAKRVTFGFKEGVLFGLGVSLPLLLLCLLFLGILYIAP